MSTLVRYGNWTLETLIDWKSYTNTWDGVKFDGWLQNPVHSVTVSVFNSTPAPKDLGWYNLIFSYLQILVQFFFIYAPFCKWNCVFVISSVCPLSFCMWKQLWYQLLKQFLNWNTICLVNLSAHRPLMWQEQFILLKIWYIIQQTYTKCLLFISTFPIYWGNWDENDMVPSS